ncbi:hypothetical protein GJ496_003957 [Pomphorhynchus laevis]|nr:hypothetical protein GJ496_003957 [Pomphorhynchus laevis]
MCNQRLVRWAIILSQYSYDIRLIAGKRNTIPDALSRLPVQDTNLMSSYDEVPLSQSPELGSVGITFEQLLNSSLRDSEILQIKRYICSGWPNQIDQETRPYSNRRSELSVEDDILLWLQRIVLPKELRTSVLETLHDGHSGIGSEIIPVNSTSALNNLDKLRELFARMGVPIETVSDNNPPFQSHEFNEFGNANAIRHIRSSLYHPKTNRLVERFIGTFKRRIPWNIP